MVWYASLKDAYGPLVDSPTDSPNIGKYSDNITPIENTIEFEKATDHIKTRVFSPNLPVRQMDSCQDYRVHLRNCPSCRDYMQKLTKPDLKETFTNILNINSKDPMIDIIVIISIGILIIFVLDSFMRLGRTL